VLQTFLLAVSTLALYYLDVLTQSLRTAYSFDDKAGDTTLASFSLDNAPAYLWSVLKDIYSINPKIKLYVVPWSPVSSSFLLQSVS
jgi:hypothetical protein